RRDAVLQRRRLQRGADPLLHLGAVATGVDPRHLDLAGVRLAQPQHTFDRGRLARAVRPQEPQDLAFRNLEADATYGLDGAVALVQVADDHFRRHQDFNRGGTEWNRGQGRGHSYRD